jgi:Fur family peroxide stress response transcriptional regulator
VYRNLSLFREEGLAASLGVINGEERFDGLTEAHPHLVCGRCGAVDDIALEDMETFEKGLASALAQSGIGEKIDFRRTMFYGLCKDCQSGQTNC